MRIGTIVFAVLAVGAACTSSPETGSSAADADLPAGARLVATIPVPDDGPITTGAGSVWVFDAVSGGIDHPDQRPVGFLLRISPRDDAVADRIPHVFGGGGLAVGLGAVWVGSPILNRLLRVDLETHFVAEITTGPGPDQWPFQPVVAMGEVWVPNHHAGTVLQFDPARGALKTFRWGPRGGGGPIHTVTDGTWVWVAANRDPTILWINANTGYTRGRIDVGPSGTCGGLAVSDDALWVTSGWDQAFSCGAGEPTLNRIDVATGTIVPIELPEVAVDVAVLDGSVWVLTTTAPGQLAALVRIDPATNEVVGRLPLRGSENPTDPMATGMGALWVRVKDSVYRVEPGV
jgi:hypothetical protein